METFIKYPLIHKELELFKMPVYIECVKLDKVKNGVIAYPNSHKDEKGNIVYDKKNRVGFYCKFLLTSDILKFKGGFSCESGTRTEIISLARSWYFTGNKKLPRKIKKKLLSTKRILKRGIKASPVKYEIL